MGIHPFWRSLGPENSARAFETKDKERFDEQTSSFS